jgi:hypothetical protein
MILPPSDDRYSSTISRNLFTESLKAHGIKKPGYGKITDAMYFILFNKNTKQLKAIHGVPDGAVLKYYLDDFDLLLIKAAEDLSVTEIENQNPNHFTECLTVCVEAARTVK